MRDAFLAKHEKSQGSKFLELEKKKNLVYVEEGAIQFIIHYMNIKLLLSFITNE